MTTYTSYQELESCELEEDDCIEFGEMTYSVEDNHLCYIGGKNSEIFDYLGYDLEGKYNLCDEEYNYTPIDEQEESSFPECECGDFEALTRITLKLFKENNPILSFVLMNYILEQKGFPFIEISKKRINSFDKALESALKENYKLITYFLVDEICKNRNK